MNSEIKELFTNFIVDGVNIPVVFLNYQGNKETYITFTQTHSDTTFSTDDELRNYIVYYDFDIFSKGNYFKIIEELKKKLISDGWTWQPTMDSADMYEPDTKYYHKTVCMSHIKEA